MKGNIDSVEELRFDEPYPDFLEFYADCKERIYRKLVTVFEDLHLSKLEERRLVIYANVDGCLFDTVFDISRERVDLLNEIILKYFEDMEDYETCSRIIRIGSAVGPG